MKLRRFNSDGIHEFRKFLEKCRSHPNTEVPVGLLEHRLFTEIVTPEIQIAAEPFKLKGDAARYLNPVLKPLLAAEVEKDAGLWTWLTLLFFDSVCPFQDDKRIVKNDYRYIFEPNNVRHVYRHLLFISWRVLQLAPFHNRLFLKSRLSTYDSVTIDIMKRLYLTRIPCIFEVLDRLYWDESKGRPRRGITGSIASAGDLTHRFPLRIRQLEMTYDLMSLTADQLIELLGDEFSFARPRSQTPLEAEAR
ncbi:MAG: hypothetical protein IH987_10500 [Planctomycetes bacterium]|nr:hypothetical protein [Planctomycetota bacterium]